MDIQHDPEQFLLPVRRDGWSPALKARFLALLAEAGNVRLSARRCGMSAQSTYVLRRRDALFAKGWAAALVLARDHVEQVLADRAIDGVEEPIFWRGEQVGARRRFDTRLLLAHLARLDRQADDAAAARAAGRFDELVAVVAGQAVPETLADPAEALPGEQIACAEEAARQAEAEARRSLPAARGKGSRRARDEAVLAAGDAAFESRALEWDAWRANACALVDGLGQGLPEHDVDEDGLDEDGMDSVNRVNFGGQVWPGLTFPAPSANGAADCFGSHPSETVGAPGFAGA